MTYFRSTRFYGVKDPDKLKQGMDLIQQSLNSPSDGFFMSDNLITFSKTLGFIFDSPFREAFVAMGADHNEAALIWRTHLIAWALSAVRTLDGDVIECGVYRGTTAHFIYEFGERERRPRPLWLYDLWAPNPSRATQFADMGDELYEKVRERFSECMNVRIIRGSVPESFIQGAPERVVFVHLDMNNRDAEIAALDYLYERIVPGGIIILDDYGWLGYRDQHIALKSWFRSRDIMVAELPTGQGLAMKPYTSPALLG